MKKIMFNDKYGLTASVLSGRKTQTRRIITCPKTRHGIEVRGFSVYRSATDKKIKEICCHNYDESDIDGGQILPKYKIGEIVAIAQSYKEAGIQFIPEEDDEFGCHNFPAEQTHGSTNKMFVRADLMPHKIRITNVKIERLHEISDEDCLKEGIYKDECQTSFNGYAFEIGIDQNGFVLAARWYKSPREAYAALIDKVSGKGTWESNPYVFVYDFELVK